jgi:hypothetical protein
MQIWEVSLADFLLVTVFLGGGAALLTGRTTARGWQSWTRLVVYMFLLTIAARFIHFSLFEGTFFLPLGNFGTALYYAGIDFIVLMAAAAIGRISARAGQMRTQYRFTTNPDAPTPS